MSCRWRTISPLSPPTEIFLSPRPSSAFCSAATFARASSAPDTSMEIRLASGSEPSAAFRAAILPIVPSMTVLNSRCRAIIRSKLCLESSTTNGWTTVGRPRLGIAHLPVTDRSEENVPDGAYGVLVAGRAASRVVRPERFDGGIPQGAVIDRLVRRRGQERVRRQVDRTVPPDTRRVIRTAGVLPAQVDAVLRG